MRFTELPEPLQTALNAWYWNSGTEGSQNEDDPDCETVADAGGSLDNPVACTIINMIEEAYQVEEFLDELTLFGDKLVKLAATERTRQAAQEQVPFSALPEVPLAKQVYRATVFEIDAFHESPDQTFAGYTAGESWNGWACPRFTKEVADRVLAACLAAEQDGSYDPETDTYITNDTGSMDPADFGRWQGEDIQVEGQTVHVYPLGAWAWVWMEQESEG